MEVSRFQDVVAAATRAYKLATVNQKLNVENPRTYQDKIAWLKIFDATDEKTVAADKIRLHEFCESRVGKDLCMPILRVYDSPDEIDLAELPNRFVLKCNHGSGYNVIVWDKSSIDLADAKAKLRKWLGENYGYEHGELQYFRIPPKCFAEEFVETGPEYQFLCFNGDPKFCQVITDRFDKRLASNNFYTMDFKFIDICNTHFPNNPNRKDVKPSKFEEMRRLAKKLCAGFKLVRVDFYQVGDWIYLSEMTFSPGNGGFKFKDPSHSLMLGNMVQL